MATRTQVMESMNTITRRAERLNQHWKSGSINDFATELFLLRNILDDAEKQFKDDVWNEACKRDIEG